MIQRQEPGTNSKLGYLQWFQTKHRPLIHSHVSSRKKQEKANQANCPKLFTNRRGSVSYVITHCRENKEKIMRSSKVYKNIAFIHVISSFVNYSYS